MNIKTRKTMFSPKTFNDFCMALRTRAIVKVDRYEGYTVDAITSLADNGREYEIQLGSTKRGDSDEASVVFYDLM